MSRGRCPKCGKFFVRLHAHVRRMHVPATVSYFAADVQVVLNGKQIASFEEISYDSRTDKAPRVRRGVGKLSDVAAAALAVINRRRGE